MPLHGGVFDKMVKNDPFWEGSFWGHFGQKRLYVEAFLANLVIFDLRHFGVILAQI